MKIIKRAFGVLLISAIIPAFAHSQAETAQPVTDCFESREGYTSTQRVEDAVPEYGYPNVKCSQTTGGVLWWGNPYDGTVPMGDMPIEAGYSHEEAVVKPRSSQLKFFPCSGCHDGQTVPIPKNTDPRVIVSDMYPHEVYAPRDPKDLAHGRGTIWCLDCHQRVNREAFVDHRGKDIPLDQPQKLCGKCHGEVYIDWRLGIHGKRIGEWTPGGKKRWWVCTECHNPHTVQVNRFQPLKPEPAPVLPKGMKNAAHEQHGHGPSGASHEGAAPAGH